VSYKAKVMKKFQYVFLDSGIGGIPYLNYLLRLVPEASALYVADTKHFPYGEKTENEVINFALETIQDILNVVVPEIIILACNTMTVSALSVLRKTFNLPFVGTVPAIKPATQITKNNRIGLISTERTAKDIYIQHLIDEFAPKSTIFIRGEAELVDKIENGLAYESEKKQLEAIKPIMSFFEKENCDTLILGCTHFLHLRDTFIKMGKQCKMPITIVDSLEGVVGHTLTLSPCKLKRKKACVYVTGKEKGKYLFCANKYGFDFVENIEDLNNTSVENVKRVHYQM
jgi:glutamate racemase